VQPFRVDSTEKDSSVCGLVKLFNEFDDGRFATSALACEGNVLSLFYLKAQVAENRNVGGGVGEADVLERDVPFNVDLDALVLTNLGFIAEHVEHLLDRSGSVDDVRVAA